MDEVILTTCPRDCYDACGVAVHKRDGAIRHVRGDPDHPVSRGRLCRKCTAACNGVFLDPAARLTAPLLRTGPKGDGAFRRVSWDEALPVVANRLSAIAADPFGQAVVLGVGELLQQCVALGVGLLHVANGLRAIRGRLFAIGRRPGSALSRRGAIGGGIPAIRHPAQRDLRAAAALGTVVHRLRVVPPFGGPIARQRSQIPSARGLIANAARLDTTPGAVLPLLGGASADLARGIVRFKVAAEPEIAIDGDPIAIDRRLVPIRRGLIDVRARLVNAGQRLVTIGERLVVFDPVENRSGGWYRVIAHEQFLALAAGVLPDIGNPARDMSDLARRDGQRQSALICQRGRSAIALYCRRRRAGRTKVPQKNPTSATTSTAASGRPTKTNASTTHARAANTIDGTIRSRTRSRRSAAYSPTGIRLVSYRRPQPSQRHRSP